MLRANSEILPIDDTRTVQNAVAGEFDSRSSSLGRAFTDGAVQLGLIQNDSLSGLKLLPSDTFNVAVTSPPYFWVRDYGFDQQIGHEPTVEAYVDRLVTIFDEVKRTLHPEGVFYLNIADTYYSGNGQPHGQDPACSSRNFMRKKLRPVDQSGWDIPKKSLIGIPWKVAFKMQEKGWTLRSNIIWERANALSEPSCRDRPHRAYEHIFLFSKSRFYSFDRKALEGQEDVWNFPIERAKIIDHNAPFPTSMAKRCILTGSPKGGRVLDPFLGSGTTMKVARELGRNCVGIDAHPLYIDEVSRVLMKIGCKSSKWNSLSKVLSEKKDSMETWAGCLRNMKKPKTSPFRAKAA